MADAEDPVAPLAGTLGLVVGLAGVAGCLDAVSLARLTGTFVGFQTGNTVLVGIGVGQGHPGRALAPAVAVVAYLVGSALVPLVIRRGSTDPTISVRSMLGVATGLLFLNALIVLVGFGFDGSAPTGVWRYASIVGSAIAMAFQTPAVRSVDGVAVSSTFSTGMFTRLGQSFAGWRDADGRAREMDVARVLGATIVAFVAGATLGGLLVEQFGNGAIVAPPIGLLLVTTVLVRPNG